MIQKSETLLLLTEISAESKIRVTYTGHATIAIGFINEPKMHQEEFLKRKRLRIRIISFE